MKKTNLLLRANPVTTALTSSSTPVTETWYRETIMQSSHAFLLGMTNGHIVDANDCASDVFGYTREEFTALTLQQLIDHTDEDLILPLIELEKTGKVTTEARGTRKNGQQFPVEISLLYFTGTPGRQLISIMITDISERKITEANIRLSNDRYDMVVKATNDLVWDWDLLTGEIFRNCSGVEKVYGHRNNDSIKNIGLWSGYLHPDDREQVMQQLEACKKDPSANSFSLEYRFRKPDGSYADIFDRGYILRNEMGQAMRMIGAAEDITARKQTQKAIEESEMRYKMFVQQSKEGIWRVEIAEPVYIHASIGEMVDYCYNNAWVAECNDAFARMYGFDKAEEIIGIPLNKILPPENPNNINYLNRFFSNGLKITEEISYETDRNGNEVVFVNNMIGIIEGDYSRRAWGTQRDITEQVKLENRLKEERQLRQQQTAEAMITGQEKERQKLGEELHDNINQILATTKLYLECMLAEGKVRNNMLQESKLLIDKAMAEIRMLSSSLLPPSLGEVGLLQAIGDLADTIRQFNRINISITDDQCDEDLLSDKLKLTIFRITQEQMNNIIKHAAAEHVSISLAQHDEKLVLVIKDDGHGFDPASKRNGVGIRNIISRAELSNGKVSLQSQPGAGCELAVTFPLSAGLLPG